MVSFDLNSRAKGDIATVRDWYSQLAPDLGNRFVEDVYACLSKICDHPRGFPQIEPGIRATVCKRFPYRVFFRFVDDQVIVLAVYHTSRDLNRWNDPHRP